MLYLCPLQVGMSSMAYEEDNGADNSLEKQGLIIILKNEIQLK